MNDRVSEGHLQEKGNHGDQMCGVTKGDGDASIIFGCKLKAEESNYLHYKCNEIIISQFQRRFY